MELKPVAFELKMSLGYYAKMQYMYNMKYFGFLKYFTCIIVILVWSRVGLLTSHVTNY